jgi:hypothetical protein
MIAIRALSLPSYGHDVNRPENSLMISSKEDDPREKTVL